MAGLRKHSHLTRRGDIGRRTGQVGRMEWLVATCPERSGRPIGRNSPSNDTRGDISRTASLRPVHGRAISFRAGCGPLLDSDGFGNQAPETVRYRSAHGAPRGRGVLSDGQLVQQVACRGSRSQDRPRHSVRTGAPEERQQGHAVHNGTGGADGRAPSTLHDTIHKLLCSVPRVIADILHGYLGGNLVDRLDFHTLQQVSAERVTQVLKRRLNDAVWRVRFDDVTWLWA